MNFNRRHFLGAVVASSTGLVAPRTYAAVSSAEPPALLARARAALDSHGRLVAYRDVVGLVDFSQASAHPRFTMVDLASGSVTAGFLVAHGRGSDPANSGWAERFSNVPGSNASSRGSFVTGEIYSGKHGRSRKIIGLDAENSLAAERAIVIHGAGYVSASAAAAQGRIGRSEGCFAVSQAEIGEVLARLGPGRLLYAWR
jgi:hypothetical protein